MFCAPVHPPPHTVHRQSSDAFTGFGRIDAAQHNKEVAAAEQRLVDEVRGRGCVGASYGTWWVTVEFHVSTCVW